MPYEEWWVKTHCPKCKNCNWFCEGDLQDCTVGDTEAIQCWSCGHKWWRDPDSVEDIHGDEEDPDELLDSCAEEAQKEPR